jgi:uncharacterized cupin superfamily protein
MAISTSGSTVRPTPPVTTVAADRTSIDGRPFQDKPTTTTPGQQERSATIWAAGEQARTGYWECGSGSFTAERDGVHEICYIVAGRATLRDAGGTVTDIGPGTVLALPAGWRGTWEVHEPVEKMFVLIRE